jgi:2-methylcitrate dehydratase
MGPSFRWVCFHAFSCRVETDTCWATDNIGAILATADVISRSALDDDSAKHSSDGVTMSRVLLAMIKAYEIQGCFQEHNAFNKVGLDHTILVKIGSTAAVSWLMGLTIDQALSAVSHAWADGHPLRLFRQSPNAGPRKGWAAGDACSKKHYPKSIAFDTKRIQQMTDHWVFTRQCVPCI